ncbi:MAG: LPS assembly lipoprotein LptE [Bacteroidota bacterium]|nr:LPS assembly lipoprotein LptE [Bacteroidota bacterium]
MKHLRILFLLAIAFPLLYGGGCKIYSLSGGRPFADTVTVSVLTFTNSAPLAKATFPQSFSETLRDAIQRQTRLIMVPRNGDLNYEGTVVGYSVAPVSIQGGGTNQASLNRLTVTVSVKYTDAVDPKIDFESSFTRFADFPSSQNLSAVEDQLLKEISDQLVQDIMNRSVNAW